MRGLGLGPGCCLFLEKQASDIVHVKPMREERNTEIDTKYRYNMIQPRKKIPSHHLLDDFLIYLSTWLAHTSSHKVSRKTFSKPSS